MLTNLVNPAASAPLRTSQAVITFSTDGSSPVALTANATANDNKITSLSSITGLIAGYPVTIDNAGAGGSTPWVTWIAGTPSLSSTSVAFPAALTTVTGANVTQWERIDTRFKPATILLENLTTGESWTQNDTSNPNGAAKTAGTGAPQTITSNGIMNRTTCVCIHPNLLAPNCNFRLTLTYNYAPSRAAVATS